MESLLSDGTDEDDWYVVGQAFAEHVLEFVVAGEEVALGDGQHTSLVKEVRVELGEFSEQHIILMTYVVRIGGHHEEQKRIALDMAQETESQSTPLAGSLYDAWYVCHDERA